MKDITKVVIALGVVLLIVVVIILWAKNNTQSLIHEVEKSLPANLVIISSTKTSAGNIAGEVKNNGSTEARWVKVYASLFLNGKIVDTQWNYTDPEHIPGGKTVGFKIYSLNTHFDKYTLQVTGR